MSSAGRVIAPAGPLQQQLGAEIEAPAVDLARERVERRRGHLGQDLRAAGRRRADVGRRIPARSRPALSAPAQTALSTARGSRATAVSRRGAARTPMVPDTTQPPSARARSASRERRPERVVAVTVTMRADAVRRRLDDARPLARPGRRAAP